MLAAKYITVTCWCQPCPPWAINPSALPCRNPIPHAYSPDTRPCLYPSFSPLHAGHGWVMNCSPTPPFINMSAVERGTEWRAGMTWWCLYEATAAVDSLLQGVRGLRVMVVVEVWVHAPAICCLSTWWFIVNTFSLLCTDFFVNINVIA